MRGYGPAVAPEHALFARTRRHLTLWYSVVLAGALLLFGVALYVGTSKALFDPLHRQLLNRATAIGRLWQKLPAETCPTPARLRTAPRLRYWACFNHNGTLVRASAGDLDVPALTTPSVATAALHTGHAAGTVDGSDDVGPVIWYALRVPRLLGGVLGVVVVGIGIKGQTDALHELLTLLLAAGPLTLLGAALGGLFLAGRALAPARLAVARQQAFIADASHELHTPLTLLRADAEVLLRGRDRLAPEDAELLEDIVAETAHMATLATNMLTLARLDSARLRLERDVVDLAAVARGTAQRATALAAEQRVALVTEVDDACPLLVVADRALLEQAALILLDNAIKYNRPGGSVTVHAGIREGQACLRVADNGIGIAAEHLAHLGERFYRVDKARSRELGGAGLGLSIARGIAVAHGGTLTLASSPGHGTTATLALPATRHRLPSAGHPGS